MSLNDMFESFLRAEKAQRKALRESMSISDEEREILHRKAVLQNLLEKFPGNIVYHEIRISASGLAIFDPGPLQWCESLV